MPAGHGLRDVPALAALVTATQKQHEGTACLRVVDPVAGSDIDAKLPHTILAELVIAQTAGDQALDPSVDGHARPQVAQPIEPVLVQVCAVLGQVVKDFYLSLFA